MFYKLISTVVFLKFISDLLLLRNFDKSFSDNVKMMINATFDRKRGRSHANTMAHAIRKRWHAEE